jgi:agmatinase
MQASIEFAPLPKLTIMSDIIPNQFLGLPSVGKELADALVLLLPFEKTVSYGSGTSGGPLAILDASKKIELFDEETSVDFSESPKLYTMPDLLDDEIDTVEDYLETLQRHIALLRNKFFLALGGEHTITYGLVKGLVDDCSDLTIVQIDAHADLADKLDGLHWSHGTVMRRLWEEGCRLIQIGIRSLSRPEFELVDSGERITTFFAHRLEEQWAEVLQTLHNLDGAVYLTIDVDGLDPSIIPSTGTPQPNGLSWRQTMGVIREIALSRRIRWLGADLVEYVPSPHPPGCDPIAARLAAKILAWWQSGRRIARAQ